MKSPSIRMALDLSTVTLAARKPQRNILKMLISNQEIYTQSNSQAKNKCETRIAF